MPLSVDDVTAALALQANERRSDFDLNPERRDSELRNHGERPAAVLIGLRPAPGGIRVILTRRAAHLYQHAGQIAFPGGKIDPGDRSARHAALREAEEEVGLPAEAVRILGDLDAYFTSTGFRVAPVVAAVAADWEPAPDPREVGEVFEPPLDFLMDPANRRRGHHDRLGYRRYFWAMPWEGRYIWGATAGMLKDLSDRLAALGGQGR